MFVSVIVTVAVRLPAVRPSFGLIVKLVVLPAPSVALSDVLTSVKLLAFVPDNATFRLVIAPVPVLVIVNVVGVIGL